MKYTITGDSITVAMDGKVYSATKGQPNFQTLREAILREDEEAIKANLTVKGGLERWARGAFTVVNGAFLYEGKELPGNFHKRLLAMATNNESPEPLLLFWERLQKNTSWRSVQQLYPFLDNEGIPFTEDGCFLAYKAVQSNLMDIHSGTVKNSIGSVHEMPRNQISDDPKEACHVGFHVGALAYASTFGSPSRVIVICKVDPADVVCVPYDCSQQKMRVCKYEVIGFHNGTKMPSTTISKTEVEGPKKVEPKKVEPKKAEPKKAEPKKAEAKKAEAKKAEPKKAEPKKAEPKKAEPKKAEPKKAEPKKAEPKKAEAKKVEPKAPKFGSHELDRVSLEALADLSLDVLRSYASTHLKVVGASKIPGGKLTLLERIRLARETLAK